MLLARIMIGKVVSHADMAATLAAVPHVQDNPAWTCRIWVKDAVAALEADGRSLGTRVTNWQRIEQTATDLCHTKATTETIRRIENMEGGCSANIQFVEGERGHPLKCTTMVA